MDFSLPGSSVHGVSQARVLEWVATSSPGDLPDPGIEPAFAALAGRFIIAETPGKPLVLSIVTQIFLSQDSLLPHQLLLPCSHLQSFLSEHTCSTLGPNSKPNSDISQFCCLSSDNRRVSHFPTELGNYFDLCFCSKKMCQKNKVA